MKKHMIEILINEIKLKPTQPELSSKKKQNMICMICGDIIYVTPQSKLQAHKNWNGNTKGCPSCSEKHRYREIRLKNYEKLSERFIIPFDPESYIKCNNNSVISVINRECNHTFKSKLGNLLNRDVNCPVCNTQKKREQFQQWCKEKHDKYLEDKDEWIIYKTKVRMLTERTYNEYTNIINPNNLPRGLAGQEGAYHLDHILSVKLCFKNDIPMEVCSHPQNLRMVEWKQNVVKKTKITKHDIPKIFWKYLPTYRTINDFTKTIKQETGTVKINTTINGEEVSVYHKNSNTVILFYVVDAILEQQTSTKLAMWRMRKKFKEEGIRSIHITHLEWLKNRELIVKKLKHILNDSKNDKKIYARKCYIREIKSKDKNVFLTRNHIQGKDSAKINLGAFYDDELVAVMTFSEPRKLMGMNKEEGKWELSRFATDVNYSVVGIASKLLKHFQRNYEWEEIYSYADLAWSDEDNNMYTVIGFTRQHINRPSYVYVDNDYNTYHRWKFNKHGLKKVYKNFDPDKTEYENAVEYGLDRYWNCGTVKYTMLNTIHK